MVSEKQVYLKIEDSIATIYINRPEKKNAIHSGMWKELIRLVEECEQSDDVSVMVFRGTTPDAFSAGADISEFKKVRHTVEAAKEYNELPVLAEETIRNCSKPSIAMIQGYCVGAGCEIAIACDFRFTDVSGKFGITPAKLGIVYPTRSTKNLVDLVGPSNAKDILFSGRIFGADEALRMGLVNRIVEQGKLEQETYAYAKLLTENVQFSVRGSKHVINEVLEGATEDSEKTLELIRESIESAEYKARVNAFLNRGKGK